jgi:signal recognition particle subunit SRP54
MFSKLSEKLTSVLGKLRGRGVLTEADIDAALREVRIALLEADVALPVVKQFTQSLKEKALGAEVIKSISPAQMVIKLVQDHLTAGVGQDHLHSQARFALKKPLPQKSDGGIARCLPPGRTATAGSTGEAGGNRLATHRRR